MTTLSELKLELEPYKNTLVIDVTNYIIVRLVDVIDGEFDYYWIYDSKKGFYYVSCVVGWIPLKGVIDKKKYNKLIHAWNLNNVENAI